MNSVNINSISLYIRDSIKHSIKLSFLLSGLLIVACGPKSIPEGQRTQRAPMSSDTVGVAVAGASQNKIAELLSKNPHAQVRIPNPNHKLYEIYGLSEQEVSKAFENSPEVVVQKNLFTQVETRGSELPRAQNLQEFKKEVSLRGRLQSETESTEVHKLAEEFLESCSSDAAKMPLVVVETNVDKDKFKYWITEMGNNIRYSARKSVDHQGGPVSEALWMVVPPRDSNNTVEFRLEMDSLVKPDTSGEYDVRVVVKDPGGNCGYQMSPLFVEDNSKFDPKVVLGSDRRHQADLSPFWHLETVKAHESWEKSTGDGILVAIIDSGVNYNNPYLAANIYINPGEIPENGIDDDANGFIDDVYGYDFGANDPYPMDENGHGSHVAGLAASPIFGIAPDAKILPIKAGGGAGIDVVSVAAGIYYAVDMGAQVINISLGSGRQHPAEKYALEYAEMSGVLIVAASGNGDQNGQGLNNDTNDIFPANYQMSHIISVAASNKFDKLSEYSNYGAQSVHFAAPGGDSNAPMVSAYKSNPRNANLVGLAGTSMAAPVVAGAAAQLLSLNPGLNPERVRSLLSRTGMPHLDTQKKLISNRILNTKNAVDELALMDDMRLTLQPSFNF